MNGFDQKRIFCTPNGETVDAEFMAEVVSKFEAQFKTAIRVSQGAQMAVVFEDEVSREWGVAWFDVDPTGNDDEIHFNKKQVDNPIDAFKAIGDCWDYYSF